MRVKWVCEGVVVSLCVRIEVVRWVCEGVVRWVCEGVVVGFVCEDRGGEVGMCVKVRWICEGEVDV